ncbi:hypothetical protein [Pararhizobium haloflavum]|nr:hypothetical protein [Pararhizobium haloflavum]
MDTYKYFLARHQRTIAIVAVGGVFLFIFGWPLFHGAMIIAPE